MISVEARTLSDTQPHNQPTRVRGRPFLPGNKFGKGRPRLGQERGPMRRQRDFEAFSADLIALNPGQPLSNTETLLLRTAVEQLDVGRLKKTHAAERCTANGLRTIQRLRDARIAMRNDPQPMRLNGEATRAVAAIFGNDEAVDD
jgi:hypothetical protein